MTAPFGWGDYDLVPDEFENWGPEPEDYCRARSGLCHPDGTCDKCGAIEGEHCKESEVRKTPQSSDAPLPS